MTAYPDPASSDRIETIKEFVRTDIEPFANQWDKDRCVPASLIRQLGKNGYLGATIPLAYGGLGWNQRDLYLLNEAIGSGCSSVRSLLTVHLSLVGETLSRWGTPAQKSTWLPALASGEKIAVFGLTEPETGSDAAAIKTSFTKVEDGYVLNGVKKWITFGQIADVILVFASMNGMAAAFLVPAGIPGVEIIPIEGVMGTRASLLAEIKFHNCFIPASHLLGREGWGFLQIANTALDNGRFSVAAGSLGIIRACLEKSIQHAKTRQQFGQYLKDHQLIKQKITNMATQYSAARLLCAKAAQLRDEGSPEALLHTSIAKYHASRSAADAASEAVQIHGASGFSDNHAVQRYYRDAKVMEIIEGSSEIQQIIISDLVTADINAIFY